jgi:hypothetical protein
MLSGLGARPTRRTIAPKGAARRVDQRPFVTAVLIGIILKASGLAWG